jgi:hypothetical protein
MPRLNGTGPRGMGPMTGRGAGFCAISATPGVVNRLFGCGGHNRGRGWRHMFYATGLPFWARHRTTAPTQTNEIDAPKSNAK